MYWSVRLLSKGNQLFCVVSYSYVIVVTQILVFLRLFGAFVWFDLCLNSLARQRRCKKLCSCRGYMIPPRPCEGEVASADSSRVTRCPLRQTNHQITGNLGG